VDEFSVAININREGLRIIGMECPKYTLVEIPPLGNIDENQSCKYVSEKQEANCLSMCDSHSNTSK